MTTNNTQEQSAKNAYYSELDEILDIHDNLVLLRQAAGDDSSELRDTTKQSILDWHNKQTTKELDAIMEWHEKEVEAVLDRHRQTYAKSLKNLGTFMERYDLDIGLTEDKEKSKKWSVALKAERNKLKESE